MNSQTKSNPPQSRQWKAFTATTFNLLVPGSYLLRQKTRVTPYVPRTELCSFEEQRMYAQVDQMERDLLNTVLQNKIREVNTKNKTRVLLTTSGARKLDCEVQHTLVIFNAKFEGPGSKFKSLGRNLADLLAMAYDQILVPINKEPADKSGEHLPIPDCSAMLHDHTY